MTKEELQDIVDVIKDKEIVIISDEIYAELTYQTKHVSIASFEEVKDQTLLINGFSKAYAMTGWRLGYACGPKVLIQAMKKFINMRLCVLRQRRNMQRLRRCEMGMIA